MMLVGGLLVYTGSLTIIVLMACPGPNTLTRGIQRASEDGSRALQAATDEHIRRLRQIVEGGAQ